MEREKGDREEEEGERWTEVEKSKAEGRGGKKSYKLRYFKKLADKKRKAKTEEEGQTEGDRRARRCLGGGGLHNRSQNSASLLLDTSLIDRQSSTPP